MDDDCQNPSNDESPESGLLADEPPHPYADHGVSDIPIGVAW